MTAIRKSSGSAVSRMQRPGCWPLCPSLDRGKCSPFGEGVALPTRLRFGKLDPEHLPRSNTGVEGYDPERRIDDDMIGTMSTLAALVTKAAAGLEPTSWTCKRRALSEEAMSSAERAVQTTTAALGRRSGAKRQLSGEAISQTMPNF